MRPKNSLSELPYSMVLAFLKRIRKNQKINKSDWKLFKNRLAYLSRYEEDFSKALDIWTINNLEFHKPDSIPLRILHEFEEQVISPEVYGKYLEAVRFGMISPTQGEQLLDDLMETELYKTTPDEMVDSISKIWKRNIRNYIKVKPN